MRPANRIESHSIAHTATRATPTDAHCAGPSAPATATMVALPYYFNLAVAEAAVEVGSHLCDLGGNTVIGNSPDERDPEDDRGFDVLTPLDVVNSDDAVATVVYTPPTAGVLGTIAATAVAPGSTLITVSVPGSDPLISASLNVDVTPGGVAVINFGEPVTTEQPTV